MRNPKGEACGFEFEKTYGEIGKGYIECHHLIPLSNFKVNKETKLEGLALLCSNCHRMIHRDTNANSIAKFKSNWNINPMPK